ncbi:hypothetical protein SUZIE_134570, partial [Sciurus carolinensis]|nr:hypothetical protein [Sciurus carolinensis]
TLPEPGAQQAGSLLLQESPELALQEARGLGGQTQADSARFQLRGQSLGTLVPGRGHSQPLFSPEGGTGPIHPERASQDPQLEQRSNMLEGGNPESSSPETERAWVLGDHGQNGPLPGSGTEEEEPDRGAPQEGGAQGRAGADLPGVPKEGASSPSTPAPASALGLAQALSPATPPLKTWCVAQDLPDPRQIPGGTGREAEQSCSSPGCTSLGTVVTADMSADPLEVEQRAPEVARPDRQAVPRLPASPDRGCSGAKLDPVPLAEEPSTGRGDLGFEGDPQCDTPLSPLAFLAPASGNQEPTVGAKDSGHLALEMGPDISQIQGPSPVPEQPGQLCILSSGTQPDRQADAQAAGLGSQGSGQALKVLSLSLRASGLLELTDTVDDPPQEARAHPGNPDPSADPASRPRHPPASSDQAEWRESPDVELDFLPDSQMQDALDVPDSEAPPEQVFPAGSKSGLCWPDPSPHARGDLVVAEVQPRPGAAGQAQEACRMADATGTVRGLVVELSNLNRLIMSTHRDLEAFKRLTSRKAKPPGKNPLLYPSRGAGTLSRGEQAWRDL